MRQSIAIVMCMALLGGCGESKPPEKTVFDSQVKALKKAREVGQKTDEAAQQQREQIERKVRGEE